MELMFFFGETAAIIGLSAYQEPELGYAYLAGGPRRIINTDSYSREACTGNGTESNRIRLVVFLAARHRTASEAEFRTRLARKQCREYSNEKAKHTGRVHVSSLAGSPHSLLVVDMDKAKKLVHLRTPAIPHKENRTTSGGARARDPNKCPIFLAEGHITFSVDLGLYRGKVYAKVTHTMGDEDLIPPS
ncbi:hypothetical protein BDW02DRAFT_575259 [Decorospora gaudefroyi]|uniref:Uncharacterized protein n=1 Tax=Decorospora gaudefroyi TaxID=184978 RepID=A0A6A5KXT7_9PLEO|nr:hypothetical protein BDW02DRAFT_575259 [Decorospora gaudefroyi]